MEQTDELVPNPDSKGYLDLTNRAWVNLDTSIWGMAMSLVVIDISFNHIYDIPAQIGELLLLRELRASFNKIVNIPPEIGKLKRLRRLVLNSNRIKKLPNEIGRLDMLEELIVSENVLEELPHTIATMSTLRILRLENNKLKALPYELADVVTLEEVNCANNPELEMLPPLWRGDSESILFICRIHRDYRARMDEMLKTNSDLSKHSQYLEQEQLLLKEGLVNQKAQIEVYRANIVPKKLMKIENTMKNEGVGGVGSGGLASGSGKADNSASNADVGTAKKGGLLDDCTVM